MRDGGRDTESDVFCGRYRRRSPERGAGARLSGVCTRDGGERSSAGADERRVAVHGARRGVRARRTFGRTTGERSRRCEEASSKFQRQCARSARSASERDRGRRRRRDADALER